MRKNHEPSLMIEERAEIRKRNITNYFVNFSKPHRIWLQDLADRYKAKGEFPMLPISILPSYYENKYDKEVAAFAALLISENSEFDRVQTFRELLGDSPWEWFRSRSFVSLSIGSMRDKRTGGVYNWKIANLMNRLWNECEITAGREEKPFVGIGQMLFDIVKQTRSMFLDALAFLTANCGVGHNLYKLRLLLLVFGTSDGLGIGLWNIPEEQLQCPLAEGMITFVQTWFPDCKRIGGTDVAISKFGFERECDFFYAFLGYKELQKRNPKGCKVYATRYRGWYDEAIRPRRYQWREILPEIEY